MSDRPGRHDLRGRRASIGEVIADAIDKVGKDGTVTVEESTPWHPKLEPHRGHAVRQGLPLAVLRGPTRASRGVLERRSCSSRFQDLGRARLVPLLEEGHGVG